MYHVFRIITEITESLALVVDRFASRKGEKLVTCVRTCASGDHSLWTLLADTYQSNCPLDHLGTQPLFPHGKNRESVRHAGREAIDLT